MSVSYNTVPTILVHPTRACTRCDGRRILALVVNPESSFAWHECEELQTLVGASSRLDAPCAATFSTARG